MKLKKWIFSSLRTKLVIMFVILAAAPLVFVGMISYLKSYNIVSEHARALAVLKAEQLNRDIDILFQETKKLAEIGKQESTIQFLITEEETYEEAKDILHLFALYRQTYEFYDSIMDINIISSNGKAISEKQGVYQWVTSPLANLTLSQQLTQISEPVIIAVNRQGIISINYAVTRSITQEVIGFIVIDLEASVVQTMLDQAVLGATGTFHIRNEAGETLFVPLRDNHSDFSQTFGYDPVLSDKAGYYIDSATPLDMFVVFNTSNLTGWKIIGLAPLGEIMKDAYEIRSLIFISAACSIIFTITLYYFISARLILPIRNLKRKMRQAASGNLDVKVASESTDEIAELGTSFNIMLLKIKRLMEKNIAEQEQLKKAELRALQAQINPHFLYNTLDTIIWMAEAKKSGQVIEITKALSHFFRITLSKGKDWITLQEEIDHIRNYLMIQKMRYRDILDTEFTINEDILQYKILKLTLQPLVENAIYHGIKNKRGKGLIRIKVDFNPMGYISIDIIDNGIGIEQQKLAEIHSQLIHGDAPQTELNKQKNGFGMMNVQRRIRLYFGEPFGLTIHSEYSEGTHICLTIPAER